jgi:hypothetical protein
MARTPLKGKHPQRNNRKHSRKQAVHAVNPGQGNPIERAVPFRNQCIYAILE